MQNIEAFLQICQTDFGLKPSDLFEAKMLYHLTDFDRVLYLTTLPETMNFRVQYLLIGTSHFVPAIKISDS